MKGDMRQGVTRAGHEVLDAVDRLRSDSAAPSAVLRNRARAVLSVTPGNPAAARLADISAAAHLILAAERADEEGRP